MIARSGARVRLARASWPVFAAPKPFAVTLWAVDAVMVALVVVEVLQERVTLGNALLVALLALIAVAFEEAMTRTARLQLRLSADLKRDMTSVWGVAAAVVLEPLSATILLFVIFSYVWLRQQRPAGEILFRKVFNFSIAVISCVVAGAMAHAAATVLVGSPHAISETVEVIVALFGYTLINRCMLTGPLLLIGVRGAELIGTRDENLIEFATLCLGGLVALAVQAEPLLAVLALAPMVTLQRGSVMRALEAAATTDAKTGLLNAVAWEEVASRELSRAARAGDEIAVLILDIDHFKRVNDQHGHLVGDRMLRLVGKTVAAQVREYDTVARFGGEEFVAVLPGSSTSDALLVAERIRSRVHELRMSDVVDGLDPAIDECAAISVGVSTAPTDGVELPDLLHAADSALYRAKAEGRNRVVLAERGHGGTYTPLTTS